MGETLTIQGIAEYLRVSVSTVKRVLADKENPIPCQKINNKILIFNSNLVDLWMSSRSYPEDIREGRDYR